MSGAISSTNAANGPDALFHLQMFQAYLASLNWHPGKSKHMQSYDAFLRAGSLGIYPSVALDHVAAKIEEADGILKPHPLRRQLQRAYEYVGSNAQLGGEVANRPPRPPSATFSPQALSKVADRLATIEPLPSLVQRSPIDPETVTSKAFLLSVYKPGEKVLVFDDFMSQGKALFEVDRGHNQSVPQGGPDGVWFLSNPVDGLEYPNPRSNNKPSRRSEESITSWRYLVLESDEADVDDWLRAVLQFPLKIVAVYSSGKRSIHCLVRIDAESKAEWDAQKNELKDTLVTLGADRGALTAVRLTRLPQCWRGDRKQELFFLHPGADGTPIIDLPARNVAVTDDGTFNESEGSDE